MSATEFIDADAIHDQIDTTEIELDKAAVQSRLEEWTPLLEPTNAIQRFLVERAVELSCELERIGKIARARASHRRRTAPRIEADAAHTEAVSLGNELLFSADEGGGRPGHNWQPTRRPDPSKVPRHPELVVHLLSRTPEGCRWMAREWDGLSTILVGRLTWGTVDERRAIRLLGKTPDLEDNAEVRSLRLAHCIMTGTVPQHLGGLTEEDLGRPVPTFSESRAILQEICGRNAAGLRERAKMLEEIRLHPDERARYEFDPSEAGKQLRRHQSATHRELLRTFAELRTMQRPKSKKSAKNEAIPVEPDPPTPPAPEPIGEIDKSAPAITGMNKSRNGETRRRKHKNKNQNKNKRNSSKRGRGSLTPPPARPKASPLDFGEFRSPSSNKKKRSRYGEETKRPVWVGSAFPSIARPKLISSGSAGAGKTSASATNVDRPLTNEGSDSGEVGRPSPELLNVERLPATNHEGKDLSEWPRGPGEREHR